MEINQTTTTANNPATLPGARPPISSDFETFLKMLTVQMENQDPLNPVDSADYAVQLATFSGVEQQVKTNDLLASLGQQLGLMGLSQLSGWVGKDARVTAPAYFNGSPITVFTDPASAADTAYLVVHNDAGQEVSRSTISVAGGQIDWAGVGTNGQPLAPGQYRFDVESHSNGNLIGTDQAQVYSLITEVKSDNGEMFVVLTGDIQVAASQITALRAAGG